MTKEEQLKKDRRDKRFQERIDSNIKLGEPFTPDLVVKTKVPNPLAELGFPGESLEKVKYHVDSYAVDPGDLVVLEYPTNIHYHPNYSRDSDSTTNLRTSAVVLEVLDYGISFLLCSPTILCTPRPSDSELVYEIYSSIGLQNIVFLHAEDIYENDRIKVWNHPCVTPTDLDIRLEKDSM